MAMQCEEERAQIVDGLDACTRHGDLLMHAVALTARAQNHRASVQETR